MRRKKVARDAITGKFTTMENAKKNPKTTVVETIKIKPNKKSKKK